MLLATFLLLVALRAMKYVTFSDFFGRASYALFATRLERLQTAVEDVPLSELNRIFEIEIVVQQVVEHIRIFVAAFKPSCCIT